MHPLHRHLLPLGSPSSSAILHLFLHQHRQLNLVNKQVCWNKLLPSPPWICHELAQYANGNEWHHQQTILYTKANEPNGYQDEPMVISCNFHVWPWSFAICFPHRCLPGPPNDLWPQHEPRRSHRCTADAVALGGQSCSCAAHAGHGSQPNAPGWAKPCLTMFFNGFEKDVLGVT